MNEKTISKLFESGKVKIPEGTTPRILARIDVATRKAGRTDLYFAGTLFAISLSAFIASGVYAVHQFAVSNFGSYFSLIFSDGASIMHWWRELGLSLIESLPIFGIVIFLASISILLWSLRKLVKRSGHFITLTETQAA